VRTEATWVKIAGDSISDMLRPFAFFRPPAPPDATETPAPKRHGGDRRSAAFQASRTPCPDCGSTERTTYCPGCGCDITATAEADETAFQDEITRLQAIINAQTSSAFQDDPYKVTYPPTPISVVSSSPFHLETRSAPRYDATGTSVAAAWQRGQPLPGFEPPPLDHRTDIAYGARR